MWAVDRDGAVWVRVANPARGWYQRALANPRVELARGGRNQAMLAQPDASPATRKAVNEAFRMKYGCVDGWYGLLLRRGPVPIRLVPAEAPWLGGGLAPRGRCDGRPAPRHHPAMSNAELRRERETIVRRHMESENAHDFDTTLHTFQHPRYEIIATGAVHDGEAAVRAYFSESRTAFPDQRNELISLRHADDGVIVEFWLLGTHRGPLAGIPATGRAFRCRMIACFLFEGAGLVCERVYFDTATILRQLGGGEVD